MKKKQKFKAKKPSVSDKRCRRETVIDRYLRGQRIRVRADRQILADWLAPVLAELDQMLVLSGVDAEGARVG